MMAYNFVSHKLPCLAVSFLSVLFASCTRTENPNEILGKADTISAIDLDKGEWTIANMTDEINAIDYRLERTKDDTLDVLFITAYEDKSIIQHYERMFPCGSDTCFVALLRNADTAFYYKQKKLLKEFIVGEYYYRYIYETPSLPINRDYFREHEDSLRQVRGNNLPDLPETEQ